MAFHDMEYDSRKKSAVIAYLLWFLAGWFGAHRFYMGHPVTGMLMFCLLLAWTFLSFVAGSPFGILLMIFFALWFVADAFLIPWMVGAYNQELVRQIKAKLVNAAAGQV